MKKLRRPTLKTVRRLIQIGVAAAFVLLPYLNVSGWLSVSGNFLFFNAGGLPLGDPLAVVQVALAGWPPPDKLLLGGGLVLLIALGLGTVFCAWGCPFGLLSEWSQTLRRRLSPGPNARSRFNGYLSKLAVAGLGLILIAALSLPPTLNQISMPGWYSRIFQMAFFQSHWSAAVMVMIGVLAVEFALRRRVWCRYVCPQTVLLTAAQLLNPFRLKVAFDPQKCRCRNGAEPCRTVCSLDLDPKALTRDLETECTNCGECVTTCKSLGRALAFQSERRKRRSASR